MRCLFSCKSLLHYRVYGCIRIKLFLRDGFLILIRSFLWSVNVSLYVGFKPVQRCLRRITFGNLLVNGMIYNQEVRICIWVRFSKHIYIYAHRFKSEFHPINKVIYWNFIKINLSYRNLIFTCRLWLRLSYG